MEKFKRDRFERGNTNQEFKRVKQKFREKNV